MKVVFLTLDEVIALHADQIERYGGRPGIRDLGLLQSALGTPSATFEERFLHEGLHEMAAAHLFHIVRNHPFVDGNKRVGLTRAGSTPTLKKSKIWYWLSREAGSARPKPRYSSSNTFSPDPGSSTRSVLAPSSGDYFFRGVTSHMRSISSRGAS